MTLRELLNAIEDNDKATQTPFHKAMDADFEVSSVTELLTEFADWQLDTAVHPWTQPANISGAYAFYVAPEDQEHIDTTGVASFCESWVLAFYAHESDRGAAQKLVETVVKGISED